MYPNLLLCQWADSLVNVTMEDLYMTEPRTVYWGLYEVMLHYWFHKHMHFICTVQTTRPTRGDLWSTFRSHDLFIASTTDNFEGVAVHDKAGAEKVVESTKWNIANVQHVTWEYGTVAVVFHTVMSLGSIGTCYTIVNMWVWVTHTSCSVTKVHT